MRNAWSRLWRRPRRRVLSVDGCDYPVEVHRRVRRASAAPRLIVVAHLPNRSARDVLRVALDAFRAFTPEDHELWVVDNHSAPEQVAWLLRRPDLNVLLNRREPLPESERDKEEPAFSGSYANAVALELALQVIEPDVETAMVFHMDVLPCRSGWLSYLRGKVSERVRAVGVRMDHARTPEGVLHVLGYLFDLALFRRLGLDVLPDLPRYDVGDRLTVEFRRAGYDVFACRNSLHDPGLVDRLPPGSPFRSFPVDRSVDDDGRVIFLHLGRVDRKATGFAASGVMPEEWVRFAEEHVLATAAGGGRS